MIDSQESNDIRSNYGRGRAMRVYTRGVDEGLVVGESVQINVLEVQTNRVRLAIIDPNASPSYREEVLYFPSDENMEPETSLMPDLGIFDDEFVFEDDDSRLIPMA